MPSSLGTVNSSNYEFTPAELNPVLWLDASDESTMTFNSSTGIYLDGGLVSPSISNGTSNHFTCSTFGTKLNISDLDIVCKLRLANWSSGGSQTFFENSHIGFLWTGYSFGVNNSNLTFTTVDTTGTPRGYSVATPAWANNSTRWIRVRRVQSNGNLSFYFSDDGVNWTQIGSTQSTFSGIIDSRGFQDIFTQKFGTNEAFNGILYRVMVYEGDLSLGGKIFDVDFENALKYTTAVRDTAGGLTVFQVSSTGGRAVTSITPKKHSFGTAESFSQATLASMPFMRSLTANGRMGLGFSGGRSIVSAQPAANWKFMNDGTQFLVSIVFTLTEANPNAIRVPISTAGDWTTSTVGWWIGCDDRSGNSFNDTIRAFIANNTGVTLSAVGAENNVLTPLEPHVVSNMMRPTVAVERGSLFVDGRMVGVDVDPVVAPSSSNPYTPLMLGRIPITLSYNFVGIIHEVIILSGALANNQARLQLENYLIKKYRLSIAGTANWIGGTYTSTATHHIVTFRSGGSFTPLRPLDVEYLIVAGGGAGTNSDAAGGGGAGGAVVGSMTMSARTYGVGVGAGGTAPGGSGEDSFLGNREIVAYGGGGATGKRGGSGAGGNTSTLPGAGIAGQGNSGGTGGTPGVGGGGGGGGAGGAGGNGGNAWQANAGSGGIGIEWPTGSGVYYASGGGGAGSAGGTSAFITSIVPGGGGRGNTGFSDPESGVANTGGGGGSTRNNSGRSGGSGIVIIRWLKNA